MVSLNVLQAGKSIFRGGGYARTATKCVETVALLHGRRIMCYSQVVTHVRSRLAGIC